MIIAKQQSQQVIQPEDNGYFELFQPAKAMGVDGKEVDIMQSIGSYSVQQLTQEKQNYLNAIASVDEKLDAIKALQE